MAFDKHGLREDVQPMELDELREAVEALWQAKGKGKAKSVDNTLRYQIKVNVKTKVNVKVNFS